MNVESQRTKFPFLSGLIGSVEFLDDVTNFCHRNCRLNQNVMALFVGWLTQQSWSHIGGCYSSTKIILCSPTIVLSR